MTWVSRQDTKTRENVAADEYRYTKTRLNRRVFRGGETEIPLRCACAISMRSRGAA